MGVKSVNLKREVEMSVTTKKAERALILIIAATVVPLLGIHYSWLAMRLTKEKDPAYTFLLGFGLLLTVFGIGMLMSIELKTLCWAWSGAMLLLLLARAFYGGLGSNFERFGIVHMMTLLMLLTLGARQELHKKWKQKSIEEISRRSANSAWSGARN
jgi:hypothetical protein